VSPASAADLPPTIQVVKATVVGGGAGLEVTYRISCPDIYNPNSGDRHALWTNGEYLEFECSAEPRTVTNLVAAGATPYRSGSTSISTHVTNCLYFGGIDEPTCYRVLNTTTVRAQTGKFVPESSVDLGHDLDLVGVRLLSDGAARVTVRLTCGPADWGYLRSTVTQATSTGVTRLWSDLDLGTVECDAGSTQERTYVVPAQPGLRLRAGDAIIESEYSACDEGCYRGLDASLVKLRK